MVARSTVQSQLLQGPPQGASCALAQSRRPPPSLSRALSSPRRERPGKSWLGLAWLGPTCSRPEQKTSTTIIQAQVEPSPLLVKRGQASPVLAWSQELQHSSFRPPSPRGPSGAAAELLGPREDMLTRLSWSQVHQTLPPNSCRPSRALVTKRGHSCSPLSGDQERRDLLCSPPLVPPQVLSRPTLHPTQLLQYSWPESEHLEPSEGETRLLRTRPLLLAPSSLDSSAIVSFGWRAPFSSHPITNTFVLVEDRWLPYGAPSRNLQPYREKS